MCHQMMVGSDVLAGDGGIRLCHLVMVGSVVPSGDGGIRRAIW